MNRKLIVLVMIVCLTQSIYLMEEKVKVPSVVESGLVLDQSPKTLLLQNINFKDYSYPVISIDSELDYFVSQNITLQITAFSSEPNILVRLDIIDFQENITYELESYNRPYMVNEWVMFNASILESNKEYMLHLLVFDSLDRNASITRVVQIDPNFPIIESMVVSESDLYYESTVEINYQVDDEHFGGIFIFVEGRDGYVTSGHRSSGVIILQWYFFDLPIGSQSYTFDCVFMASDYAGNSVNESFTITYHDDRKGGISAEEQLAIMNVVFKNIGVFVAVSFFIQAVLIIALAGYLDKRGV